ncbi:MAG: hypothetical protein LBL37_00600, partial [Gracilibacteraceae bacterium]|nr:hypothetical protein [Gracilibacteraceae bacterium]
MNKSYRGMSVMRIFAVIVPALLLLLSGCQTPAQENKLPEDPPPMNAEHISDIAYDTAPRTG